MFAYNIQCHSREQARNVTNRIFTELREAGYNVDSGFMLDAKIEDDIIKLKVFNTEDQYIKIDVDSLLEVDEDMKLYDVLNVPTYSYWLGELMYNSSDAILERLQELLISIEDNEDIDSVYRLALIEVARARYINEYKFNPAKMLMIRELLIKISPGIAI
jgi:hypothetical protein